MNSYTKYANSYRMTCKDEEFLKRKCDIEVHATVVVGEKGQVVVPKAIRDQLKIAAGDALLVVVKGNLGIGLMKEGALATLPKFPESASKEVKFHSSVTVGDRGQVVIPKPVRDAIGIVPGDTLITVVKHAAVIGMVKVQDVPRMMEYMRQEMEESSGSSPSAK